MTFAEQYAHLLDALTTRVYAMPCTAVEWDSTTCEWQSGYPCHHCDLLDLLESEPPA